MKHIFYLLLIGFLFSPSCQNRKPITHSGEIGKLEKIDGVNLWVTRLGQGEPLFLIAGGPGSSHVYLHNFDSLKDSNLLVFIDFYGRGQSDTSADATSYTIDKDVDHVDSVRRALGFEKINILGHSFGSVIAQKYAIKYDQKVNHLIIVSGFYSGPMYQAGLDSLNQILSQNETLVWDYYDSANKKKEYDDPNYPNDPNKKVYFQFLGENADDKVGKEFLEFDVREQLKNLKMPILFLAGRYDRICLPDSSEKFKVYCPKASFEWLEKSGHYPQVEETAEVIDKINQFLKTSK